MKYWKQYMLLVGHCTRKPGGKLVVIRLLQVCVCKFRELVIHLGGPLSMIGDVSVIEIFFLAVHMILISLSPSHSLLPQIQAMAASLLLWR